MASSKKDPGGSTVGEVSSRKLRKRELDRNAQRNARERTRNRIAYLERLVEDLRHENAGGPVARLMEQLSEVTQERDDLSKALRTIENVLTNTKGLERSTEIAYRAPDNSDTSAKTESSPEAQAQGADTPMTNLSPENIPGPDDADQVIIPGRPECACSAEKAASLPPQEVNKWRFANEVLSGRVTLPESILRMEDALSEDTPVRAMIEGWDAVEASGRLPPLYQKLRRIDETIFATCSKVDRLAIMRLMHLLLRYHAGSTEKRKADLPSWYLSRYKIPCP